MPLGFALIGLWKGLWGGTDSCSGVGGQEGPVGGVWIAERNSVT
jgi:hypothetical protein